MKVLFLDSWTVGVHNFLPIAAKLKERGVNSLLVHRGSWGDEPNRPSEELIGGLLCRDIRYYNTKLIHKVFKKERPDAIVILTTRTFMDRAAILSARALGIHSYFLMHGVVFVGEKREADMHGVEDTLREMRWKRIGKYLRYILPNYFYSGFAQSPSFILRASLYSLLWKTFFNPAQYYWTPPPSPEVQCDKALVWGNIYREHFHKTVGYPYENIRVVGPPPLDPVLNLVECPPSKLQMEEFLDKHQISRERGIIVYLETPAVETEIEGWNLESRLKHFDEIIDAVARAGKQLVVKLHPSSEIQSLEKYRNDKRVHFVRNIDLASLLYVAESVIGFISSTLDLAIVLGKPLLTPTWGISANLPDDYLRNGAAVPVETPIALITALQSPAQALAQAKKDRDNYINHFITFTDGNAVNRICEALVTSG